MFLILYDSTSMNSPEHYDENLENRGRPLADLLLRSLFSITVPLEVELEGTITARRETCPRLSESHVNHLLCHHRLPTS